MDDSFKLGWDPPYKTLDSPKWGKSPTLSGATIDCGPWTKGVGMCDSKDHKACLFNMDNGQS